MEKYLKDEPRRSLQSAAPSVVVAGGSPSGTLKKSHSEMDLGTTGSSNGGPWDRFQVRIDR